MYTNHLINKQSFNKVTHKKIEESDDENSHRLKKKLHLSFQQYTIGELTKYDFVVGGETLVVSTADRCFL